MRDRDRRAHAPLGAHRHLDTVTIVLGALITLAGIASLVYAARASAIVLVATGVALVIGGGVRLVEAIAHRERREPGQGILTGVLYLVVGGMMLWRPELTLMSVTLLLAALFFAGGIARAAIAVATRHIAWGWTLVSGLLSIMLGLFIAASWPVSSLWLVGTLVGVELVGAGMALVASGFFLNRIERRVEQILGTP